MAPKTRRYGLRLILPGAPATFHITPAIQGYYRPDIATPVGEPGEVPLEAARAAAEQCPDALELVEMTDEEAAASIAALAEFRSLSTANLAQAVRAGGAEGEIARDEIAMNAAPAAETEG